jgi:hypothetical protein
MDFPLNLIRKGITMDALQETVEKLKETGVIGLEDFRSLKMKELEALTEEIKEWCLYGNGKPEKLGKKHKKH